MIFLSKTYEKKYCGSEKFSVGLVSVFFLMYLVDCHCFILKIAFCFLRKEVIIREKERKKSGNTLLLTK